MFKKGLRHLVLFFLSILTPLTAEAQNFTLSNNLLYDAALTPNLRLGYAPDSTYCVICCSRLKYAIGRIR